MVCIFLVDQFVNDVLGLCRSGVLCKRSVRDLYCVVWCVCVCFLR